MSAEPTRTVELPPNPSRRQLLAAIFGLWGVAGAGLAVPLVRYLLAPLTMTTPVSEIPTAQLDLATAALTERWKPLTLEVAHRDAWLESGKRLVSVYARQMGPDVQVLSGTCTHLGCHVNWEDAKNKFHCPCHAGEYDAEGKVLAGPPPKPLAKLPARIEAGNLVVELPVGVA
ncbi:MAG TPA: ubiquinol-cytochrome c reductase iron-sulfur subunit [bacterium]|nr:ubiquinol-cytochrome c reductase iron-sulfur subunit [bacterium]